MNSVKELGAKREQAALALERLRGELADLLQRSQAVAELVTVRRAEQRTAAIELERSGGKINKELTQRVAALNEAVARGDALAELCREKQGEVEAGQVALTGALRAEGDERHRTEVADALAEVSKLGVEIKDAFSTLALAQGAYLTAYGRLETLDRDVAVEAARAVSTEALTGGLAAVGCEPLTFGAENFGYVMAVPAMMKTATPEQNAA